MSPTAFDGIPGGRHRPDQGRLTTVTYITGLMVVFGASYSQYLVSGIGLVLGAFCVYAISILVIFPIYGRSILRTAFRHNWSALRSGLGYLGALTLLSGAASFLIVLALRNLDPNALTLLSKPVPVLNVPPELAWVMVWASIVIVGPCEEFIFRGFVFGGLLRLFGSRHWLVLAFLSSLAFAAVHLYYALAYGVASLIPFVQIVALGMAFAIAYFRSGGNLLIPALIHGLYDATGFMTVAVSPRLGTQLRGILVVAALVMALVMFATRGSDSYERTWA